MRRRIIALTLALLALVSATTATSPAGATNPGDLSDKEFVIRQYEDFLGRAPDAGGLAYWTSLLQDGESPAALIEFMVASPEFERSVAPMVRLYYAHLRRSPDYGGLRFWTGRINAGEALETISENFTESAEFQAKYGALTDVEYVDLVYVNVLERTADAGGRAYWIGQLDSGVTRGAMMSLFSESAEFKAKTNGLVKASMLYVGLLQRSPDKDGLDYWAGRIDSGIAYRDIMAGFLESAEYRNRTEALFSSSHPLTGQLTGQLTGVPALAIKIDNAPGARPHIGLSQADIVYEEMVEGNLSRFIAVFQSQTPGAVGPVRSIRTGDFDVLEQFNTPLLGASGANRFVLAQLKNEPVINVNALVAGGAYYRTNSKSAPHNLLVDPAKLWDFAGDRGGIPSPIFSYRRDGAARPGVAESTGGVKIDFGNSTASYQWDVGRQGWLRTQNGTSHVENTGRRIAPDNVVVQVTQYQASAADGRSPEAVTIGSGEAFVFTDGFMIRGTWSRSRADAPMVLKDQNGKIIKLTTGSTWVELAPPASVTLR